MLSGTHGLAILHPRLFNPFCVLITFHVLESSLCQFVMHVG
uniref:Uncharacterized protein n=1 Tax=Arundo donax TaxID=35708 RepID=A0A0A8ZL40_ARUDO